MRVSSISLLGAVLLAGCSEWQQPGAPAAASFEMTSAQATTYSGDATVVQARVLGLQPITLVRAGPLPPSGGEVEASLLEAEVPGLLTAQLLHASTVGGGAHSRSEASVANLELTVGGANISAGFLMSRAEARCAAGAASASGSSEIAALSINGQAIVVSGEPNQTIELPGLRVVINEQNRSVSGNSADITVNALHVTASNPITREQLADVVVSSAHADISCAAPPPPPTECKDFVTGGGWITGTPSGAKGNFGVAGGIKHGAFWGHLTYIDHGANGLKVKGTGVTGYERVDATTRRIRGTAEVNGEGAHTYEVLVTDLGEPGRNDRFDLRLSSRYSAAGSLGGGNIQLHENCP